MKDTGEKHMQDATRIKEQIDDMINKADIRAEISTELLAKVSQQKSQADASLTQFKLLEEVFTVGQNLLNQRKTAILNNEEPVGEFLIKGIEGAIADVERLLRQAQDQIFHWNGAQSSLHALEQLFTQEKIQATARARGLAVQGEKAVELASRKGTIETKSPPNDSKTDEEAPSLQEENEDTAEIEPELPFFAKTPIKNP